jgi:predicted DNA-binding protein
MRDTQISVRVPPRLKRAVDQASRARGVSQTRFVQDALLDKLEEIADMEDLPKLRRDATRPLRDVIRDLGLDGEL